MSTHMLQVLCSITQGRKICKRKLHLAFFVHIEIVVGTLYVGNYCSMLRELVDDIISRHYWSLIAILTVVSIFLITFATREYINFTAIQQNIAYQQEQQKHRQEKIDFEKNFLIPYLDSSSALFFYQHENNILGPSEYIVHIERPEPVAIETITSRTTIQAKQQARHTFLERVWAYVLAH